MTYRSRHQRCSIKKGVLRNFVKSAGKQLCLRPATLLKRDSGTGVFLWFYEISKNIFFTEHLCATASGLSCSV